MKRIIAIIILVIQSLLCSNPIDNTPITKFSELVFDDNDNWTMELQFPFGYRSDIIDSVTIKVSGTNAKLKSKYSDITYLITINSDSLSVPLNINRNGDKIEFFTYSNIHQLKVCRKDSLIFGDFYGSSVGQPMSGYSICRVAWEIYDNNTEINCLTRTTSLGVLNDTTGLSGELSGHIFGVNGEVVKGTKLFPVSQSYFELDTPLKINSDGSYLTKIFRKFNIDSIKYLNVRMEYFNSWRNIESVEPFELKDIKPDTIIIQDIHLKSNRYIITSVDKDQTSLPNNEVIIINYPNPFNSSTNFYVSIPDNSSKKSANILIYNINGQLIRTIPVNNGGTTYWDGKNMGGSAVSSGIYYYQLNIDKQSVKNGSMILLK